MRAIAGAAALLSLIAAVSAGSAQAAERTGRWLVLFEDGAVPRIATAGVTTAGAPIPRLDIAVVDGPAAAIRALRRQPGVERVVPEYRREFRAEPNDPGWTALETAPGTPAGTTLQWAFRRERFPEAWDITTGAKALVGVIDSGVDGTHPDLAGKIAVGEAVGGATSPLQDEDGHGTHVSGIACAATDNGLGLAGAGFGCRIVAIKAPELRDADIVAGIDAAVSRGADAINMSFGGGPPSAGIDRAIDAAYGRGVVLVAAASNDPDTDQGSPASQLQPGDAADLNSGRGIVVTAANFNDQRAGTGLGPQISMAAYGFFGGPDGPPGLISTYPGAATPRESLQVGADGIVPPCECRTSVQGDDRYAYLQGTSMAVPQVTAAAALIGDLNPDLSAAEKLRILKETARRAGGWSPELGWGILDAGAALDAARRVDRTAPSSRAGGRRAQRLASSGRSYLRIRLSGRDRARRAGLVPSGIQRYDVYLRRDGGRYRRVRRARRSGTLRIRISRAGRYRVYTRATDAAGNREAAPRRADLVTRVR